MANYPNTEPNHLSTSFRQALYQHTEGHPLFVVELLRDMQERGDLVTARSAGAKARRSIGTISQRGSRV